MGWKVGFEGPIRAAWQDGRLILHEVKVQYGLDDSADEGGNFTRFNFELDRVELKVSLVRFLAGRGLIEEAAIDGARGLLDKRFVKWIEGWRWKGGFGDLDMKRLSLRNVHFNVLQPPGYHSYSMTILQGTLPRLRLSWLFYDFLNAEGAQGIFDGHSLFTLESEGKTGKRFKLLGMDVKHLTATAEASSPLTWLTKGFVDIEASLQLPLDKTEFDEAFLEEAIEKALVEKLLLSEADIQNELSCENADLIGVQASFTFRNLKARQPTPQEVESLLGGPSSRLKMTLLASILGYLNEHRPEILLSCALQLSRGEFLGVWSGWECGLFGGVALGLDEAFKTLVWDPERRMKRLGRVGRYALHAFLLNKPLLQ